MKSAFLFCGIRSMDFWDVDEIRDHFFQYPDPTQAKFTFVDSSDLSSLAFRMILFLEVVPEMDHHLSDSQRGQDCN